MCSLLLCTACACVRASVRVCVRPRVCVCSISGESEPTRRGTRGGSIMINGEDITQPLISLPDVSSVHQHDVPNVVLTVMEVGVGGGGACG